MRQFRYQGKKPQRGAAAMNRKHVFSQLLTLVVATAAFTTAAQAFDHLEITVVSPNIVDGHPAVTVETDFSVQVRAVNADGTTDVFADFINAQLTSPDVAAILPSNAYLQNGERQFDGVRFLAAGQPVRLRVYDADDGSVPPGEALINCFNFVDRFTVSIPAGDKFIDQPVAVTLTALDDEGQTVRNFGDDIVLDALIGNFSTGPTITVSGLAFSLGVATIPVTFWGTDPVTRENELTATNTVTYPGQARPASGSAIVSPLRPGPAADIILLLPGEVLTPGVSPGKNGTPIPQTSGSNFGGITVYATDQRWNPIESGPYPTLAWNSSDFSPGVVLPATAPMGSNPATGYTTTLIASGTSWITATASGPIVATSRSDVIINPQGLDHFEFDTSVWDPNDPQVTTIPFNIRIIARDSNDNVFPLNGQVGLRVRIGASDESVDYIISNNTTFTNGYLDALVQVTKRGFSARILVDSGVVGESPPFQVNSGPCNKILISFPGETWVNGLNDENFSGNQGTPDPATAGNVIYPVTLRPVDRYNNLAPGSRNVTLSCPSGYFQLPDYPGNIVNISNPVDIRVILRTAEGAQFLRAQSSGIDPNESSSVLVSPGPFARLVVEAPGEILDPGIFDTIEDDGKIGDPSAQDAGVPFATRVYTCDQYWNPVSDLSPALPMTVDFSSSDAAAVLPSNPQTLNDNTSVFDVTLITLADPNQQTVRVDDRASGAWAYTTIPIKAGVIDHFDIGINNHTNPTPADVLDPIPDHRAGSSLPNVTIVARDVFGNHIAEYAETVTLWVSHGPGVLTPTQVDLGDGFGAGTYEGVWRGPIQITRTGVDVRLFAREETYAKTDSSNAFTVFADAQDYADLLVLLPGETHTPGIAPGKVGTPLPVIAGDPVVATVYATDANWNRVPARPQAHFTSSSFFQMVSDNDLALDPDGSKTFDLFFKTATTHDLAVADLIAPGVNDTSTVLVDPGEFDRLMLLLPGETPEPGGPQADGKTGSPSSQTASLQFDVRIRSTDQFWNLVDNSTEHVRLASDDDSITPTNPLNNDQPLVNGEIVMPLFLTSTGFITLAASALDHTDIQGQLATVEVEQGAQYQISTPATAYVGPPSTFTMSVALVDSNGVPLPEANNWVTIDVLRSNLEPASSTLQVTQAQLSTGSVTIPNQAYDTVEDIVVRITDNSGRQSYSSTIQMLPNGLEYVVTVGVDPLPRVGPPSTFPVTVRLRDVDTHTTIDDDRRFDVTMMAAAGGIGQGVWGTASQRLDHGQITFQQSYTRAENVYVSVTDTTGLSAASPVFAVRADGYKRLQIIAPGETVAAGIPAYEATGKSGTPTTQRSGEPFPLTVRAVDQYWNLADTTNVGRLRLVASDNSFSQPGNPDQNFVPFVNGRRTFNAYLTDEGVVSVTVYDEDDLNKPSQSSYVPVDPPFEYEITVPPAAPTGPVPGFQVTVKLIDPVTGNVVPTAQNRFYMTPLRPNRGAASGTLGITDSQLIGGVRVLNTQSYSTVEDIIIRVTDDYGREAFSDVIEMETGGLYYAVTVPDSAYVGPPRTFPVTVELIDSNTGQRVTTQDRLFTIEVMSAQTGLPGVGHLEVRQGMLVQGIRDIAQAYTRAEDIFITVTDTTGVTGISNTCRMLADGFKRIQIVAPGETAEPGLLVGDGKTGAPLTQQAEVPFVITVRAVDQYWNLVRTIDDGTITLASSGGALDIVDAGDVGAPFINGSRDIEIVLGNPGLVSVFATDPDHPTVSSGRVDIPVNEAEYRIILPDPPVVTAGPPATFTLTVRLENPENGERIDAGNSFTMTALQPDRTAANSTLGITSGTLTAGEAVINGQYYDVSEPIIVRVRDNRGRESFSDVLTVVPEGVRYAVTIPDTVIAGEPFEMTVRRVDIVTGQLVTNDDRNFVLNAFSGHAPRPDPGLTPSGVLADTVGTTVDGVRTFTHQSYDRAESIYLRVSDDTGEQFFTETITVLPAPLFNLAIWAEDIPGHVLDRPLRPREAALLQLRATDRSGNPVPGRGINVHVVQGDGRLGSAKELSYGLVADVNGAGTVTLTVTDYGRVDVLLQAVASDILSDPLLVQVTGPPVTTIAFAPEASAYGEGYYVLPSTAITLSATTEDEGGIQAVFFDVDVIDPPRPAAVYGGAFTLADLGAEFATPGAHVLRFFAEESSGIVEAVHSVTLYTTTQLTTDKTITNRPNPFRAGDEETVILFHPTVSGRVTVSLYDLYGELVYSDQMDVTANVTEQYVWNGRNGKGRVVANGGYICRVHGNGMDLRRKIAVVK
jgi:hypothetical protein